MTARWLTAILIGVIVAGIGGLLAWALSPVAPELTGVIFTLVGLPFGITLGWIIAVAPRTMPTRPHPGDSVESRFMNDALAGTATDIVAAVGLCLAAVAITRAELPTQLLLLAVLVLAFASTATRYTVARVRASRV